MDRTEYLALQNARITGRPVAYHNPTTLNENATSVTNPGGVTNHFVTPEQAQTHIQKWEAKHSPVN